MFKVCVGHSDDVLPEDAMRHVIETCQVQLDGCAPQAGLFFTSNMECDHQRLLGAIMDAFPGIHLAGCTTDGEVSDHHAYAEDSMALLLMASDRLEFSAGLGRDFSRRPLEAAREARSMAFAAARSEPKLAVALPDGLSTIGAPLAPPLRQAFGEDFPLFGGTAGDHYTFKGTLQFFGREVLSDALPVLTIGGDMLFSSAIRSGWATIGERHPVTSAEANVVRTIGERTALEFYKHYLGPVASELTQFPLAVFEPDLERFYLRDPIEFDEQSGAVTFVGTFPDNCEVMLSEAGRVDILAAADQASQEALDAYPGQSPDLALIFSCASRRQILGLQTGEERRTLAANGPESMHCFGFYTYGEIGPFRQGGPTRYHNDTFVALVLGED